MNPGTIPALLLPFLGGLALGTVEGWGGVVLGVVGLLLGAVCQRVARLYADPWDDFYGIEGDD